MDCPILRRPHFHFGCTIGGMDWQSFKAWYQGQCTPCSYATATTPRNLEERQDRSETPWALTWIQLDSNPVEFWGLLLVKGMGSASHVTCTTIALQVPGTPNCFASREQKHPWCFLLCGLMQRTWCLAQKHSIDPRADKSFFKKIKKSEETWPSIQKAGNSPDVLFCENGRIHKPKISFNFVWGLFYCPWFTYEYVLRPPKSTQGGTVA